MPSAISWSAASQNSSNSAASQPASKKTARNYLAVVTDAYEYRFKEQLLGMYMKVEPE
jgi:hypothetical protein